MRPLSAEYPFAQQCHISVSEDNELTMKLILDKEWTDFIGVKAPVEYRTIKLEIPSHLLSDLTVKTTNGTIKVSDLPTLERITLDSNGGNVEFEKIAVEENDARKNPS